MAYSDQLRNSIQDQIFGGSGDVTAISTLYFGLSVVEPGFDGSVNSEPAAGSYARVPFVNSDNNWDASASGVKRNASVITFPEATASWGLVTHATLWTNVTSDGAGAYWGSAPLGTSKNILSGDTPSIPVGSLSFTVNSSS